jgi:hypothetical protein
MERQGQKMLSMLAQITDVKGKEFSICDLCTWTIKVKSFPSANFLNIYFSCLIKYKKEYKIRKVIYK